MNVKARITLSVEHIARTMPFTCPILSTEKEEKQHGNNMLGNSPRITRRIDRRFLIRPGEGCGVRERTRERDRPANGVVLK